METIIFIGMMVLSYLQFVWLLKEKKFISMRQTIILALVLLFQLSSYLLFNEPYLLIICFSILQPIFIVRTLKNWLSMVLFLYLENSLIILSWLFTNDLLTFLFEAKHVSDSLYLRLFPVSLIGQQLLLFALIQLAKWFDLRHTIFDSVAQIQKNYKIPALLLSALLISLSVFKHLAIFLGSTIDFFYLTFLLLTLSLILCSIAYFYSLYYQEKLKKMILYQQYSKEMEKITLADEFRHDYHNILLSLMGYIENDEMEKALDFISSVENYSKNLLEEDDYDGINHLTIPAVQGLLIQFIESCEEKKISFNISIPQMIQEADISIQLIDFLRCISALFDYALKKNSKITETTFYLSIEKEAKYLCFNLTNIDCVAEPQESQMVNPFQPKQYFNESNLLAANKILSQYKETQFSTYSENEEFIVQFALPIGY